MENIKKRLKRELQNVYNFTKMNGGEAPKTTNVIYGKYNVIKKVIEEVEKSDFLKGNALRRRILNAESYEFMGIELAYSRRQLFRIIKSAEDLFVEKAIELELVK